MNYEPFIETTGLLNQPERLKAMLAEHSYLFLRQIMPIETIMEARRDVLQLCRDAGWVRPDGDLMEGLWSGAGPFTENEPEYMELYREVLRTPSFVAVPNTMRVFTLLGEIIGGPIVLHRRHIGRITFPQNVAQTTAIHQDWHYVRGTPDTYTLWTPLGDCPRELGGLAVLAGSHQEGYREHTVFEGKKYAAAGLTEAELPTGPGIAWHTTDFKAGDALLFHSHTIHKALPNLTPDRLRLSTDNRYQRSDEEMEAGAMGSHYRLLEDLAEKDTVAT